MNRSIKFFIVSAIALFGLSQAYAETKINWEILQTPSSTQTLRISNIDQNSFVVSTTSGEIYKTNDGKIFTNLNAPKSSDLYALHFADASKGVFGGYGGQVYYTNNGGDSWIKGITGLKEEGTFSPSYIFDLGKVGNKLYATGIDGDSLKGFFMTSADNGANWNRYEVPLSAVTTNCYIINDTVGYLAARSFSGGSLYKTEDGGKSWTIVLTSSDQITSVNVANKYAYAVDAAGKVYKSANNGNNWDTESLDASPTLYSVNTINDSVVVVCGANSALYISENYGKTWTKPGIVPMDQEFWDAKVFGNSLYFAGSGGKVFKGTITITNVTNEPTYTDETLTLAASKTEVKFNLSSANPMSLNLFDLSGREITNINFENGILRNQKAGVYVYKVKSQSGKEFFGKLIIE